MPSPSLQSAANRVRRVSITIPASGGTADTLENLVVAAMNAATPGLGDRERPWIMGGRVNGVATAYNAGDSVSSQPLAIGTSTIYEEPAVNFLKATFVKSSGSSIAAIVSVYLGGGDPNGYGLT